MTGALLLEILSWCLALLAMAGTCLGLLAIVRQMIAWMMPDEKG